MFEQNGKNSVNEQIALLLTPVSVYRCFEECAICLIVPVMNVKVLTKSH
jgi:hypothetical protein